MLPNLYALLNTKALKLADLWQLASIIYGRSVRQKTNRNFSVKHNPETPPLNLVKRLTLLQDYSKVRTSMCATPDVSDYLP